MMRIKHITLNTCQGGRVGTQKIIEFLKKEDADLVHLQEMYDGKDPNLPENFRSMEVLKKELSYPYSVFHPALLDTRSIGSIEQGNAIFSKYPIISSKS